MRSTTEANTLTDKQRIAAPNTAKQIEARKAEIKRVLHMHAGVRDALVTDEGSGRFRAYVVPDDFYMDEVMGRSAAGSALVSKWRKTFDLSQFDKRASAAPVGFNTMGWNSSYTRGPIPLEEMREWVGNTVGDVLRLKPEKLLEIGCGTGMLVIRIAPQCERYVAVDQSPAVLARLKEQLQTVPEAAARVEVVESQAAELNCLSENAFDTVVLSSVVQFFPDAGYLTKVLENAISLVKPGGRIYVGDVRSLRLWRLFASSVELFQAPDGLTAAELRDRIDRRLDREPELVISPAYFLSLPRRYQKISRVDIRPLRGRADNEMTRFRYESILHIGPGTAQAFDGDFLDQADHSWTLDEIRALLKQHRDRPVGVKGIGNARITRDLAGLTILEAADDACPAGELRRKLDQREPEGIHPQALLDLETEELGFAVFLSWAACRNDGTLDAFFVPRQLLQGANPPAIKWPDPDASSCLHFANAPGQVKMRAELTNQLMELCNQALPQDSAPHTITLVDSLEHAGQL